jgi:hypothetical protein
MLNMHTQVKPAQLRTASIRIVNGLVLMSVIGCGGSSNPTSPTSTTTATAMPGPQAYLAPSVAGAAVGINSFTIDDAADTFSQSTFLLEPPIQQGAQVINAGVIAVAKRGLRSLGITANYVANNGSSGVPPGYYPVTYRPPEQGSYAVELAGQVGGLEQLVGQPMGPLVAATQCPTQTKAQTYLFVTIPAALAPPMTIPRPPDTWDPTSETAYGSVDVTSSGQTVTFQNIQQFTLPSEGGTRAPSAPAPSSATGACGSTFFGNTIAVPGQLTITNPGNGQSTSGQAVLGLGASGGLLVEDNGLDTIQAPAGEPLNVPYVNVLGAGTGAVGVPQPSSPIDAGAAVGAQYLGFIYAAGVYPGNSSSPTGWSSYLASFGFSNVPSGCASIAPPTKTLIYGGDFTGDDPSSSPDGYGNCDFAIDLGTQSVSRIGLFPNATVWVGASYAGNTAGLTYSFPAIAISGQIGAKYVLFVLGVDSTQPWAIDLLQSN